MHIQVGVKEDLSLIIRQRDGRVLWETSKTHPPILVVRCRDAEPHQSPLANANAEISVFDDEKYRGHRVILSGFESVDICLELIFAIDATTDKLLVQAAQIRGSDTVVGLEHLYRFEKPVFDGGYMVLPHGPGYLIPAECPDKLPARGHKGGLIGGRWTLPMFGIVRGVDAICAIVETWWDCDVSIEHTPANKSTLDFGWLGRLDYPRRLLLRFGRGMDYVAIAKIYCNYARQQGLLRTLEEKAVQMPAIRHDIESVLFRWPA